MYFIIANERYALESEETRCSDITDTEELNHTAISGIKKPVEEISLLGRIMFSTIKGFNFIRNSNHTILQNGSLSFSIMTLYASVMFDSRE